MRAFVTCELASRGLERLRQMGFDVELAGWGATGTALAPDAYSRDATGAHLLLTEVEAVTAQVLARCPDLLAVGTARGGPVNVDVAACDAAGVPVLFAPGRNAESVADAAVATMIAMVRRLSAGERHLRASGWMVGGQVPYLHFRGPELSGLVVGLVGYGAVGRAVARRLAGGFGSTVLFTDPDVAGGLSLEALLRSSDVVSLHCPRTPATERLLRAETLALMRPGSWLVNTAGGACVDEDDLVAALDCGHLAGAALDVFATEPLPPGSPLLARDDVVLTPHLAGAATDVVRHHTAMLLDDVERLLRGEPPEHDVPRVHQR